MADELININVVIAERPYPVRIRSQDEAGVKSAAEIINAKLKDLQQKYDAKDKQDFLAMILLMNTLESMNTTAAPITDSDLISELGQLDRILQQALAA